MSDLFYTFNIPFEDAEILHTKARKSVNTSELGVSLLCLRPQGKPMAVLIQCALSPWKGTVRIPLPGQLSSFQSFMPPPPITFQFGLTPLVISITFPKNRTVWPGRLDVTIISKSLWPYMRILLSSDERLRWGVSTWICASLLQTHSRITWISFLRMVPFRETSTQIYLNLKTSSQIWASLVFSSEWTKIRNCLRTEISLVQRSWR